MNIGVIGYGVVGKAISFCFKKIGHYVTVHDIKLDTDINDVIYTDVIYICVSTKRLNSGCCDTSIVEEVVYSLVNMGYSGHICVKSTVVPGTLDMLIKETSYKNMAMVPEFLRERCAISDFTDNHDVCIIGTYSDSTYDNIVLSHGTLPQKVIRCSPGEAEMCKYFSNLYNATLITFANSFYEVCEKLNLDYTRIKNICVNREHIVDEYLECNNYFRGFGGVCLPKDLSAINCLINDKKIDVNFFKCIEKENKKYKKTVYDGMRD